MTRITVLGAGFAALTAARRLRRADAAVEITLVAPGPEFHYLPSLIWVPTGLRRGADLQIPLETFLARHRIRFHAGRVRAVTEGGRRVHTDTGEIRNDGLLIASGGRFLKSLPGIEHALTLCEGIPAAEAIRERLAAMGGGTIAFGFGANPKEPTAMRGGPMFELLFGIDTLLRRQGRRSAFRLVFFHAATEPGKRLGEKTVRLILREMHRRGIETRLGHKPLGFEAGTVRTEGGEIPADLILFMPGMTGPAWLAESEGFERSAGGLIRADAHCRVTGLEACYVAGDSGSFPGPDWMPKQAHMADLQARAAADNLLAELAGRPATATFRPELVCIIDMLDRGILVYRSPKRTAILRAPFLHHAKRLFERIYLRRYRGTPAGAGHRSETAAR